jgi:hypothetical protein
LFDVATGRVDLAEIAELERVRTARETRGHEILLIGREPHPPARAAQRTSYSCSATNAR